MPLVTITASHLVSDDEIVVVSDLVHEALVSEFGIGATDKFHILLPASTGVRVVHPPSHQGIVYSDRIVIVQVVANNTRTESQKQRLCAAINSRTVAALSFRPEDIIISLHDVPPENWSFGRHGSQRISQEQAVTCKERPRT
jgi:4-oxalocrotonate tautomerase